LIVLDASAALEVLRRGPAADAIEARVFAANAAVHAPHLIDLEVAQVLRRQVLAGQMSAAHGAAALVSWRGFPVERHGHELLIARVWALRETMTAYDAAYVALAETLGAVVVTMDRKLAAARGHGAQVEVMG
jgi:predicted nucleic acid-binding protein